jgi:hypothetical protein
MKFARSARVSRDGFILTQFISSIPGYNMKMNFFCLSLCAMLVPCVAVAEVSSLSLVEKEKGHVLNVTAEKTVAKTPDGYCFHGDYDIIIGELAAREEKKLIISLEKIDVKGTAASVGHTLFPVAKNQEWYRGPSSLLLEKPLENSFDLGTSSDGLYLLLVCSDSYGVDKCYGKQMSPIVDVYRAGQTRDKPKTHLEVADYRRKDKIYYYQPVVVKNGKAEVFSTYEADQGKLTKSLEKLLKKNDLQELQPLAKRIVKEASIISSMPLKVRKPVSLVVELPGFDGSCPQKSIPHHDHKHD